VLDRNIDVGTSNFRTVVQVVGVDPYAHDPAMAPPASMFVRAHASDVSS
jgi:hypothetical protein